MKLHLTHLLGSTVLISLAINCAFQQKAHAWINICNRGSTDISRLAIGFNYQPQYIISTGSWTLKPGGCARVYDKDLANSRTPFLYYVEGQRWQAVNSAPGGFSRNSMCIATNQNFYFYSREYDPLCGKTVSQIRGNQRYIYQTKVVKVGTFRTSGRNYILNLTN